MPSSNSLVLNVSKLIGQLQVIPVKDLANAALDRALKTKLPQKVLEIFSSFEKNLRRWGGENHHISDQLHMLLNNEQNRIAQEWRTRLRPRPERNENQEYQAPQKNGARVKKSPERKERNETKQSRPLHISDLPYPALETIFKWLPPNDKAGFFHAAAPEKTENVRQVAITETVLNLSPFLSDVEIRDLYELVFGEPLPPKEIAQKRDDAQHRGDTATVLQIDAQIGKANRTLNRLKREWAALPKEVRELFGKIDSSKIPYDPASCKSVLKAIRAHNLVCVGKSVFRGFTPDLSTQKGLIEAGEMVANRLQKEGDTFTELNLWYAKLTCLPLEITRLKKLKTLVLFDTRLSVLPPQIGDLINLTELHVSSTYISALPPEIGKLSSLTKLDVSWNKLSSLPPEIGKLSSLNTFSVSANRLSTLPPEILELSSLTDFDVSHNRLSTLPSEIRKLRSLKKLEVSWNYLSTLPREIGKLRSLKELDISWNNLSTLPPEIWKLSKRAKLNIDENRITLLEMKSMKKHELL